MYVEVEPFPAQEPIDYLSYDREEEWDSGGQVSGKSEDDISGKGGKYCWREVVEKKITSTQGYSCSKDGKFYKRAKKVEAIYSWGLIV